MTHETGVAEFLWDLLDDIDTLDDACRSDDALFREKVWRVQKKRWETGVTSDGYTLDFSEARAPGHRPIEDSEAWKIHKARWGNRA